MKIIWIKWLKPSQLFNGSTQLKMHFLFIVNGPNWADWWLTALCENIQNNSYNYYFHFFFSALIVYRINTDAMSRLTTFVLSRGITIIGKHMNSRHWRFVSLIIMTVVAVNVANGIPKSYNWNQRPTIWHICKIEAPMMMTIGCRWMHCRQVLLYILWGRAFSETAYHLPS